MQNRSTRLTGGRFPNSVKGEEAGEEKEKGSEGEWQVENVVEDTTAGGP